MTMTPSPHRLLLPLLWILPMAMKAQTTAWELLPGPLAATINIISITAKGTLLAGTDGGGVFRSTDRGEHWSLGHQGRDMSEVGSVLYIGRDTIFAGDPSSGEGLFRSTDDGITWKSTDYINDGCDGIVIDRAGRIIAGGGQFGLSVSIDSGDYWFKNRNFPLDIGLSRFYISNIILDSTGAIVVFGSRHDPSLLRSTDSGATWTEKKLPTYSPYAEMTATSGSVFLGSFNGIYRSTDGGLSWEKRPLGPRDSSTNAFAVDYDGAILAGVGRGLLRSTDDGLTWTPISEAIGSEKITALAVEHDGTLYAGVDGAGFYRSTDRGKIWQQLNDGLSASKPTAIAVDPKKRIIAAISGAGVFRSSDGGATWSRLNGPSSLTQIAGLGVAPNGNIFVSTNLFPSQIYRSIDDGATWMLMADTTWSVRSFWFGADGGVLGGTYLGGIYRSADNGATWTSAYTPRYNVSIRQFDRMSDGTILAATSLNIEHNFILRSTNEGISWDSIPSTTTTADYLGIAVTSHDDIWTATQYGPQRSTDRGATWQPVDEKNDMTNVTAFGVDKSNRVYLRNPPYWGVIYRTETDKEWGQNRTGLATERIKFFTADSSGSILMATDGGGIYHFVGGTSSVPLTSDESSITLAVNSSADQASIRFSLPTTTHARLDIYDLRGSLVASLLDEQLAAGEHEGEWNTSAVASGVYLVRLRAGDRYVTTRVVVQR